MDSPTSTVSDFKYSLYLDDSEDSSDADNESTHLCDISICQSTLSEEEESKPLISPSEQISLSTANTTELIQETPKNKKNIKTTILDEISQPTFESNVLDKVSETKSNILIKTSEPESNILDKISKPIVEVLSKKQEINKKNDEIQTKPIDKNAKFTDLKNMITDMFACVTKIAKKRGVDVATFTHKEKYHNPWNLTNSEKKTYASNKNDFTQRNKSTLQKSSSKIKQNELSYSKNLTQNLDNSLNNSKDTRMNNSIHARMNHLQTKNFSSKLITSKNINNVSVRTEKKHNTIDYNNSKNKNKFSYRNRSPFTKNKKIIKINKSPNYSSNPFLLSNKTKKKERSILWSAPKSKVNTNPFKLTDKKRTKSYPIKNKNKKTEERAFRYITNENTSKNLMTPSKWLTQQSNNKRKVDDFTSAKKKKRRLSVQGRLLESAEKSVRFSPVIKQTKVFVANKGILPNFRFAPRRSLTPVSPYNTASFKFN